MDLVFTVFVALGLLVAAWPWLLLAAVVAIVGYLLWAAIRRRRGDLLVCLVFVALTGCSLAPSDKAMEAFSQNERSWCVSISSVCPRALRALTRPLSICGEETP